MRRSECGFADTGAVRGADLLQKFGPTIGVRIGLDPNYVLGSDVPLDLPEREYRALVDTGAAVSCVDANLAAALHLPIVDRQVHSGAGGRFEVNIHAAQIFLPELGWALDGRFAGVYLEAGGQPYHALLGRDFLKDFRMLYDGETGQVTLSRED